MGNMQNMEFHEKFSPKYTNPIIAPIIYHKSSFEVWYSYYELQEICAKFVWEPFTTIMQMSSIHLIKDLTLRFLSNG